MECESWTDSASSLGRWWRVTWPGLVSLAAFAGCADRDAAPTATVYPVKGRIVLADGRPLSGGRVVFVSTSQLVSASGSIGPDGSFALASGGSGEGAPPGEYKVRIEPDTAALARTSHRRTGRSALPFATRYTDEDSSTLVATVRAEPNDLEPFRLTK